ncbi:transmembrane 7 superfamily member 3-like [Clytia hemisphaerica]|uniref:transmembrane 7 superfamily member 3-like n=1 Tax=Clytia hemisphaerica TaxID=252671 RepID=UPI0034D74A70
MHLLKKLLILLQMHHTNTFYVDSMKTMTLSQNYKPIEAQFWQRYSFVIVQSHTQHQNSTLSYNAHTEYGQSYQSLNSGLIQRIDDSYSRNVEMYVKSSKAEMVNAVLLAVPVENRYPIPGGCCLTCALENDPNIKIKYDEFTSVTFHRASKYYSSQSTPGCDNSEKPATYDLVYDVYYYYIDQNNYEEDALFDALYAMSTPTRIRLNGIKLTTIKSQESLSVDIETLFAQGIVLNVIVSDSSSGTDLETAYVPAAVYACNFTASEDSPNNCQARGSTTVLIFCISFAVLGFLLSVAGFKCFRLFVFSSGVAFYWFIIFIVMSRYLDPNEESRQDTLMISFLISLVGGGFTLFLYGFEKCFYLVFHKTCLVFGMFLSAIIFYTPFGYFEVWNEDYRFILMFACFALFFSMVCLFIPKAACYLSSSLIGSFAVIMVPNYFLRGNMQYIILTIVNRITVFKFGYLYLRRPYDQVEYILTGVWGGLFILGCIIQYCTTKDQDFQYSGKQLRHKVWSKIGESVNLSKKNKSRKQKNIRRPVPARQYQRSPPPQEERRPLLADDHLQPTFGGYGGFDEPPQQVVEHYPEHHQPLLHQPLFVGYVSSTEVEPTAPRPSAPVQHSPPNSAPPPYQFTDNTTNQDLDSINNQNVDQNLIDFDERPLQNVEHLVLNDEDQRATYRKPSERYPKVV